MGTGPVAQEGNDVGTAGVIARPPLLFLAALLLGFVSDRLLPLPLPVPRIDLVHWIIAGSLILIGLALAAAGIRNFSRAGTPVPTNEPTRALVTTGIHGWSRNPIYVGIVGINHAAVYTSYEGHRAWPTDGMARYRHPVQEASEANRGS